MVSSAVIEIGWLRVQLMAPGTRLAMIIVPLPDVATLGWGLVKSHKLARGRDRDWNMEMPSVVMDEELMNHGGRTSVGLKCM